MATLVNGVTHLLAHTRCHWDVLDALHSTLHSRILVSAQQASPFVTRCEHIDVTLDKLLAFNASTSASARAYYLSRAVQHAAPAGCGLLFAAAAATLCDGTCSNINATRTLIASLPCAGPSDEAEQLPQSRVRELAMRVVFSTHASSTGATGCPCRAALGRSLGGSIQWPSALLDSAPSAATVELAAQDDRSPGRRCVFARMCGATEADSIDAISCSKSGLAVEAPKSRTPNHRSIYLTAAPVAPVRKQCVVGCAQHSTTVIASLAAAHAWVHSQIDWGAPVSVSDIFETFNAVESTKASHVFDGDTEWGDDERLDHDSLHNLGYAHPEVDRLLVYVVVEDVEMTS